MGGPTRGMEVLALTAQREAERSWELRLELTGRGIAHGSLSEILEFLEELERQGVKRRLYVSPRGVTSWPEE